MTRSLARAALFASAVTLLGPAQAEEAVATEAMAARIKQALATTPNASVGSGVTVVVRDGRYVLQGFVQGNDNYHYARDALEAIEGLDLSLIDDRIIRN